MRHCENQALINGYKRLELMATLAGEKLYQQHGYLAQQAIDYPLSKELTIKFVPMVKQL